MRRAQRLQQLLQFDQRLQRRLKLEKSLMAGVDEAGRGPLAGPVVAGAVVLYSHSFDTPIDDSKRLSAQARERAFHAILRSGTIGVGAVYPEEIDRLGIHVATHLAMRQAIERLPVRPALAVIDGRFIPSHCPVSAVPVVGGDAKSLVIACASIVAKVIRDRWMNHMDRFHPEYGFRRHKGYGTPLHIKRLREIGPSIFHRYSFRPIRSHPPGDSSRVIQD